MVLAHVLAGGGSSGGGGSGGNDKAKMAALISKLKIMDRNISFLCATSPKVSFVDDANDEKSESEAEKSRSNCSKSQARTIDGSLKVKSGGVKQDGIVGLVLSDIADA
eukprot:scaffold30137_cov62-Attheya_sp.AAC.2